MPCNTTPLRTLLLLLLLHAGGGGDGKRRIHAAQGGCVTVTHGVFAHSLTRSLMHCAAAPVPTLREYSGCIKGAFCHQSRFSGERCFTRVVSKVWKKHPSDVTQSICFFFSHRKLRKCTQNIGFLTIAVVYRQEAQNHTGYLNRTLRSDN